MTYEQALAAQKKAKGLTAVILTDDRDERQKILMAWAQRVFGETGEDADMDTRALRFLEEAMELAQAFGLEERRAHIVTSYVYRRPWGVPAQEIGGVMVTLSLLAEGAGLSVEKAETMEIERVLAMPDDYFRRRQAEKLAAGL